MSDQALAQRYKESPLTALVRRTSSKRVPPQRPPQISVEPPAISFHPADDEDPAAAGSPFRGYGTHQNFGQPLHSPLLHGHFARDSVATASSYDANSYLEHSSPNNSRVHSFTSSNVYPDSELDDGEFRYDDAYERSAYEESVYSQPGHNSGVSADPRDSWQSTATTDTVRVDDYYYQDPRQPDSVIEGVSGVQVEQGYGRFEADQVITSVVQTVTEQRPQPAPQHAGRARITAPVSGNFSRPLSRPGPSSQSPPQQQSLPPPVQGGEEQKRQVLLRNAGRSNSNLSQSAAQPNQPSSLRNQYGDNSNGSRDGYQASSASQTSGVSGSFKQQQSRMPVPPPMASTSRGGVLSSSSLAPPGNSGSHSNASHSSSNLGVGSRAPRERSNTPNSVYSNYSYYPFDGVVPSPTGSTFSNSKDPFAATTGAVMVPPVGNGASSRSLHPNAQVVSTPDLSRTPAQQLGSGRGQADGGTEPQTPHHYLLLGIEHHEHDRLRESAGCFEKSAKENGGCGVGMLMWGLALRHGWGCEKNEKAAFKWLQKAAESAVGDLEATRARGIQDTSVVKNELVLAIYEVGQCFFQGWGVPKDQKMAFSYYTLAAQLGDSDAQMDLAFCLTNGKGCKKDKKEAAKWYRAAVKLGQSDVGLAWIYKDKYK